jgi:hypothetical protein
LKNKSKFAAQRKGKKNDALALKTILSGLSSPIKESMGQFTFAKDLWLKLEETYQRKKEDIEYNSINSNEGKESCDDVGKKEDLENISNEGKESSQTLDCNNSKCDDVDYFSTSEEENLEIVCVEFDGSYSMERIEEELLELQKKVEGGLYEYSNDHYYIDYSYL